MQLNPSVRLSTMAARSRKSKNGCTLTKICGDWGEEEKESRFRVRAANHLRPHCSGCPFYPHTSRAPPGFATQDHAQARDSNAARGNTQDMEATSAKGTPKSVVEDGCTFTEIKPCEEGVPGLQRGPKAAPPRPAGSIFRSHCHLPAIAIFS
jgi:hypothetical protein